LRTEWIQESVLEEWEKRGKAAEDDNDGERTKRVKKRKNFPSLERGGCRELRVTLPVSPKLLQLAGSDFESLIFGS